MKIAVIGGGVMGLSIACAVQSHAPTDAVTLFDRFPLDHVFGSSHGRSRIVRISYPDPFYAGIMVEAMPMWREWQAQAAQQFLFETGLLYFGASTNADIVGVREALGLLQVHHQVLSPEECRNQYQNLYLSSGEEAVFANDGGWVHADRVRTFLAQSFLKSGGVFVQEGVSPSHLCQLEFDQIVVATGAWITDFASLPATVKKQTVAYVRGTWDGPAWIDAEGRMAYGFPNAPSESGLEPGFKIGIHLGGIELDAGERDSLDRTPDPLMLEEIQSLARDRFGVRDPQILEPVGCLYTNLPNDDFAIWREDSRTVMVSPCSGHGFKFAPCIGRQVAREVIEPGSLKKWHRFSNAGVE